MCKYKFIPANELYNKTFEEMQKIAERYNISLPYGRADYITEELRKQTIEKIIEKRYKRITLFIFLLTLIVAILTLIFVILFK